MKRAKVQGLSLCYCLWIVTDRMVACNGFLGKTKTKIFRKKLTNASNSSVSFYSAQNKHISIEII
jgi:hypothetical protein